MNSRRWLTALAVLALFAGLAGAQVVDIGAVPGPFACTASVVFPPTSPSFPTILRIEGLTELVSDVLLICTGGTAPVIGSVVPTADITVSFDVGANVTSRLFKYSPANPATVADTSEALLLIDEPGSGLPTPSTAGSSRWCRN